MGTLVLYFSSEVLQLNESRNNMNTILPICVVVALIATAIPVESVGLHGLHRPARSSWGYDEADGPAVWHTLDSDWEVCDTGTRQSPIDLTVDGDSPRVSEPIVFSASYADTPAEGTFVDNGHTVQFSATMPNTYTMTGGPLGMEEFQFLQLHFHWGSVNTQGSEHTINGREYPMEMHLVHINSKYVGSGGELDGLYATEDDGLAVIGFMFKMDPRKDYAPLTTFTDGITALSDGDVAVGDTMPMTGVDLGAFTKYVMDRGYFNYLGSLTTPGCNEVVTWINAKKYLKLSQTQMDVFRSTHHDDNYRPPQPIGDRIISKGLSQFAIDWLS